MRPLPHAYSAPSIGMLALLLAAVFWSAPARAECEAFPTLFNIVQTVEEMKATTSPAQLRRAGQDLDRLRKDLTPKRMAAALEKMGQDDELGAVMTLRVNLGALSQLAMSGGPARTKPFVEGSGFNRSLLVAKRLTDEFCFQDEKARQSEWATMELTIVQRDGVGSQRQLNLGLASMGMLAGGLICLLALAEFIRRRDQKYARNNKRLTCNIPVILEGHGNGQTYFVLDLSLGGAKISTDLELEDRTKLGLIFGAKSVPATVIWSNQHFTGVAFDTVLTKDEMTGLLALQAPSASPDTKNATPSLASRQTVTKP